MARRFFDLAVVIPCIVALVPVFLLVTLVVKLTSQGPVIFRQLRVGRYGQSFVLYKFRTMKIGEEGPLVSPRDDLRITSLGRFLRKWKIDELPQLWNVLRGDMSIVGPRPEVQKFVKTYTPEQQEILKARPGLAGVAQLLFPDETDLLKRHADPEQAYVVELLPNKLALDLQYEQNRTFITDLCLAGEILLLVLTGKSRPCSQLTRAGDQDRSPAHNA